MQCYATLCFATLCSTLLRVPALTGVYGDDDGPVSVSGLRPSSLCLLIWSALRCDVPCWATPLRQLCSTQYFAMASCAIQGFTMPCFATRCCATQCYAVRGPAFSTQCYASLCFATLCFATLCFATLCYAMLSPVAFHPSSGSCSDWRLWGV